MLSAFVSHDPDEFLETRHGLMAFRIRMHLCLADYPAEWAAPMEPTKRQTGVWKLSVEDGTRESALELGEAAQLPEPRQVVVAT